VSRPRLPLTSRHRSSAATLILLMTGCELTDITLPPTEATLVVTSVLNTAAHEQYAVVENSRSGSEEIIGYFGGLVPDVPPTSPVSDAVVILTHLTPGADCANPLIRLVERPLDLGGGAGPSGTYFTEDLCALRPNDIIALEVRAPDGRVVHGYTRIPGARSIDVGIDAPASLPDTIGLHRLNDSLRIGVDPIAGRGLQVEIVRADRRSQRRTDGFDSFSFPHRGISDTMGLVLAGSALAVDGSNGDPIFQAGHFHAVTIAVTDTNYFDFTRSGNDDFTGRGFLNHLDGGIGVFGSVTPVTRLVRVTTNFTDPREGIFRMTGSVNGQPVDVTWEVYLDPSDELLGAGFDIDSFFAFVEGIWAGQPIATSAAGTFGGNPYFQFGDFPFSATFEVGAGDDAQRFYIGGTPEPAPDTFDVNVFDISSTFLTAIEAVRVE